MSSVLHHAPTALASLAVKVWPGAAIVAAYVARPNTPRDSAQEEENLIATHITEIGFAQGRRQHQRICFRLHGSDPSGSCKHLQTSVQAASRAMQKLPCTTSQRQRPHATGSGIQTSNPRKMDCEQASRPGQAAAVCCRLKRPGHSPRFASRQV